MNGPAALAAVTAWLLAADAGAPAHPLRAIGFAVFVFLFVRGALRSAARGRGL